MDVLICDDEPDIRLLYRTAFEHCGVTVSVARDGNDVVDRAQEVHPNLIVLDLAMPGRDGLSALPELREKVPEAAVVVVTAYASVDNFRKARALGAAECFDKIEFLGRIPGLVARFESAA